MNAAVRGIDGQLASAKGRSRLFWLLAEGLLNGLTTGSWSSLGLVGASNESGTAGQLDSALENLLDALDRAGTAAADRLAVEHTRLFAGLAEGAGPTPPFESAWWQDETGEIEAVVADAYTEAGFADIDLQAGPQDHLAVELKFMALLAHREAEAWQLEDPVAAEARIHQQQAFLDRHILQWVPRWIDQVAQNTQEPVYWAFAGLISAALAHTAEVLKIAAD